MTVRGRGLTFTGAAPAVVRAVLIATCTAVVCAGSAKVVSAQASPQSRLRPFDHARHESVSCTSCHGTGERHRTLLVQTARDCASCHHSTERRQSCTTCHSLDQLPPPSRVAAKMSLTVWDSVGTRPLPFRHDVHLRAGAAVACRDCHGAPVTLAMNRECASCHQPHHRPEASCSSCHPAPRTGVHPLATHLSCSGSGCHAAAVAPPPTLCLTCHTAQRDHEPEGSCASCHRIPPPGAVAAGRLGREVPP